MARDYYDESKKKKKKEEQQAPATPSKPVNTDQVAQTVVKKTASVARTTTKAVSNQGQSSVSQKPASRMTDAQYQKTYGQPRSASTSSTQKESTQPRKISIQKRAQIATRLTEKYGGKEPTKREPITAQTTNHRATGRSREEIYDPKRAERETTASRALKKTPALAMESAKSAAYGHATTLFDIASIKSKGNGKSSEEIYSPKLVEQSRQQSAENVKKYQAKTEQTEKAIEKLTKNAKGIEKAYYGAVESGTGMATDLGIGLLTGTGQVGSLAAMASRTYGSTRGKAQKEGATEAEDRAYAAVQAAKEAGTELLFPGVGLARGYAGKAGLSLADTAANILTKNLKGVAADAGSAGVRLIGGVLEENAEELAGWGLDPLLKEITYGRSVRNRNIKQAQSNMRQQSDDLRANIRNEDDARAAAAYLASDDFLEQTIQAYREAGLSKKDAEDIAERMKDYLTASLTGDTDEMEKIEEEVSNKVAGSDKMEWDFDELKDTIASTTLLTAATGLPQTGMTAAKGAALRDQLGADGVRALAATAIDFEDGEMSLKAKAMKDRLDSGKELTSTQVYDLQVGMQEQIRKDSEREQSSRRMADKRIKSDNLLTPYRQNRNGGLDLDEATEAAYREHVGTANDIIEDLSDETRESLTDTEKVNGSKAIAGFQTGVFTVDDANALNYSNTTVRAAFETATGINLGQYVVRKSNGEVDIPATNTKTKDALFAMAADNLVESAKAETANWMDNAKGQVVTQVSARMGASGTAVLQQALDDVDERDRSKYMMTANATDMLYQAGRNLGTEWEDVASSATKMFPGISETKLKAMYEAGLADRQMASDTARGRQIKLGESLSKMGEQETATGKVFVDSEVTPKGTMIRTFTEIAQNLGADIHLVDEIYDVDGSAISGANGSYDSSTNTFYLNIASGAEQNVGYIFMHECTHYIKTFAPEQYQALQNLVRERWFGFNPSQMQEAIARKIEAYKKATNGRQVLTEEQALEEIIADASHEFLNDPNFAKAVADEDMGLAKAVLDSIRNALRMLRRIFASGRIDDETHMNSLFSQLDILTEAEELWLNAYKAAVHNSAVAAVDQWQDEVNAESRLSLTTDEKALPKGSALPASLKKWAKEVGLDTLTKQDIKGPVIVSVKDLRTAWYEKNNRNNEAETINSALASIGDSLTNLVGEYRYIDLSDALNATVHYRTDSEGKPTSVILSCQVKNAEYEVNFDFTTICAKRLAMQKVLEKFIKTEGEQKGTLYDELKLDEEGMYKLRLILEAAGFEVSCRGCFVEQNRYSQQGQARTIANDWNAALDAWAAENGVEITENFDLVNMDINNLDYDEIEKGFKRYHELMKGKSPNVETKNRMLIEASPFFRKRMNSSDYASLAGQRALMAIGESKKGGTSLYGLLKRGQSDSKQSVPFTAYNGEVALLPDKMKGKDLYDYLLSIGGARAQSASDFQIEFLYDYMQLVADLSARGLPMHMYTKVIELAELFGMTGIKINMSAMCDVDPALTGEYAGLKLVDGKYEYNISDQSIDYPKAVELQKKEGYSKNIGIIMVTLSSQHMLQSLDDPNVRYIIGYHSSAMPVVVANMSNMGDATDYTKINKTNKLNEKGQALFDKAMEEAKGDTELEKYKDALRIFDEKIQEETAKKEKKPRRGNEYGAYMSAYGNNTADFNTYDSVLETKDARKTADKYLEHCMENGLIPIYFPFAFHENYYKCEVYDFNMYDNNTGEYAPMESVQNIYPGLDMTKGETDTTKFMDRVSETMGERNEFNEVQSAMYEPVFEQAKNELRYSITGDDYMDFDASGIDHSELIHRADAPKTDAQIRDDAYMDAVNSGNMEEAQRLVDEVAEDAGYTYRGYHGTPSGGFTVFDGSKSYIADRPTGFNYFTDNLEIVNKYYAVDNSSVSGEKQIYDAYLRLDNPLTINANKAGWSRIALPDELKKKGINKNRYGEWDTASTDQIARYARENGYDGVIFKDVRDGTTEDEPSTVYAVVGSSQIKSADPVTYAEDGSVIPLSERFDPSNNDIRYSLPTQDSDGNILSDGQMEYFKNSQARDEEGKLQVVYHSTNNGGFTIFDPSFSDDHRSLFFTDNLKMSRSYFNRGTFKGEEGPILDTYNMPEDTTKGTYATYLNLENPLVVDGKGHNWDDIPYMGEETNVRNGSLYLEPDWADTEEGYPLVLGYNLTVSWEQENNEDEWVEKSIEKYFKNPDPENSDYYDFYPAEEIESFAEANGLSRSYFKEMMSNAEEEPMDGSLNYTSEDEDEVTTIYSTAYNTREISEIAYNEGHDGVIIRNIKDYGGFGYGLKPSDVYIAFSSNQVKDTRNENPSENPDIRYSIVDPVEARDYAARTAESIDDIPLANNLLEENRVRYSMHRDDFINKLDSTWNEKDRTYGFVLNEKSVKRDLVKLMTTVRKNSETGRKYDSETLQETINAAKKMYYFGKAGMREAYAEQAWKAAERIVDNIDYNDDLYVSYKRMRDYLSRRRIAIPESLMYDEDFTEFVRDNYGRMRLEAEGNSVEAVYKYLSKNYPELFVEEMEEPVDMLLQIDYVLDLIEPYRDAYTSEEYADLVDQVATSLCDIVDQGEAYTSVADTLTERFDTKVNAMKQRHQEAMRKANQKRIDAVNKVREEEQDKRERQRLRAENWKKKYYERIAKEQEDRSNRRESALHKKYFASIGKTHKWLVDRLLTNTKDKHIPEQYKHELAAILAAFDLRSAKTAAKEDAVGADGYTRSDVMTKKSLKMLELQSILEKIHNSTEEFHINDAITDIFDNLTAKNDPNRVGIEGKTLDQLSAAELKEIDRLLKALRHEFSNYESVRIASKRMQAADLATAQIKSCMEHALVFGEGRDYQNLPGGVDKIINLDEMTPAYVFKRIDPNNEGLGMMFKELRRSFDKYVRNQEKLNGWMEEILGEYHSGGKLWKKYGADAIEQWRSTNYSQTFKLSNDMTISLTPAQMMSIFCLAGRKQAYNHMTGAGIVVVPVSYQSKIMSDLKKKINKAIPYKLNDDDIKMICSALTDDQIKVAKKLQQLMVKQMADWGNEASMNVIGIKLFNEPDYFPIKSDRAALEKDLSPDQFMQAIRNFGFTKAVQPRANNAIAVDDIFDVVAEHCNNMNLYNAYTEAINDFMKVYNYHQVDETKDVSVEQAVANAYSKKATTFIMTFMKDLNGNVSKGRSSGITDMMNDALGKAKKSSVFANGRVALQQPTALARAFAVIAPKYLLGAKTGKEVMQEMFEHCPIALWKSWGYYDINMGKSIEDIMMNEGNWLEDKMTDIYGKFDNFTWSVIWAMCKNEIKAKNPNVEVGSDEFYDLVNDRMTEVVDLTQVVDSPFHRSHAMRSKDIIVKLATSFMAEPTLTFNMLRDGLVRAYELNKIGKKGEAAKVLSRTTSVWVFSAATTAAFAAVWDAVRNKGGDDGDDDEDLITKLLERLRLWWPNTVENFKDNLNVINNIYYFKDIASLFQGWDQRNLGLQGWKHLADAKNQLLGTKKVSSNLSWYENALAGIGYLTGLPLKTLMNDGKAILNLIGLHPSVLSYADDQLMSLQDMLGGEASASGFVKAKGSSSKSSAASAGPKPRLWDYENSPFNIKDGSIADNFLNAMGINLTQNERAELAAKAEAADRQQQAESIKNKTADLTGEARDKKVWSYVTSYMKSQNGDKPMTDVVMEGDYETIRKYRIMYLAAGGNENYFDERIFAASKSAMKKTIVYDPTQSQIEAQTNIKNYLLSHGMSDTELSQMAYESITARDMKVAFRINDKDAMLETLAPLVRAGLSYEDLERLWNNRNKIDIKKYKESDGRYADRLKSTGTYNWPINGQVTSRFGHRSSPGGIGSTNHQGLDIAGNMGDPVGASDGGTVIYAGWYSTAGKTIMIQHDDGTVTQYSHLSWYDANVGDVVAQGQTIGNVGSTGNSTGPHLHFGVKINGSYTDPLEYLASRS